MEQLTVQNDWETTEGGEYLGKPGVYNGIVIV
jgi:hypothetical protein